MESDKSVSRLLIRNRKGNNKVIMDDSTTVVDPLATNEVTPTEADHLESVKFDGVLCSVGFSVRYQGLQLLMIGSFWFTFAFSLCGYLIIGYEPPHVCAQTNETELLTKYSLWNDTTAKVVYEMCQIRIMSNTTEVATTGCVDGYSYEGGKAQTLKTEWDLVCDKNGVGELVATLQGVGMVIGSVMVGSLPDRFGRKRMIGMFCLISSVFEIGISFAPSIYVVIALKFLSGITLQAVGSSSLLFWMEIAITKHREIYAFLSLLYWAVCMVVFGCISYAMSAYSWRDFQLVITICGAVPLLYIYFIDESLPWLFAKARHCQALEIIKKVCIKTGRKFDVPKHAYEECRNRLKKIEEGKAMNARNSTVAKYGFLDIIFNRRLLITTLILGFSFFTHSLGYMGLYLTSATFKLNHHLTIIIMAILEIPSNSGFFIMLVYTKKRQTPILFFLPTAAVCLLVSACLVSLGSSVSDHINNSSMAFFFLGKFALDISFCCLDCFIVEHYPTTARHAGLAFCNFVGRFALVFSPYLYPLYLIVSWAPNTILSALCFLTTALHLMLPETKNKEMPSTITEAVAVVPRSIPG